MIDFGRAFSQRKMGSSNVFTILDEVKEKEALHIAKVNSLQK
jgi:hypothetical protein